MCRVNVSLANFADLMIDYPNSKEYAFNMFSKMKELGLFSQDQLELYKQHLDNLENMDFVFE